MKRHEAADAAAEAQLLASIRDSFANKMPFNRWLGIEIVSLHHDAPELRFAMRPELIGNPVRGILHGGVIAAVLDVTGGLAAFLGVLQKLKGRPSAEVLERFNRIGTIDLRVDYLRPGSGDWFVARGVPLRTGNKVAVARAEMFNDRDELIAVGMAAYTVY